MDVAVLQAVETRRLEEVESVVAVSRSVLELRLEALAEEKHQIRVVELLHVAGSRLEVVRLGAGRREIADAD